MWTWPASWAMSGQYWEQTGLPKRAARLEW
jgi:hypothetical protein